MTYLLDVSALLALLQDKLCEKAARDSDPEFQDLAHQISHLKTTIKISEQFPNLAVTHPDQDHVNGYHALRSNGNGSKSSVNGDAHKSQGDMVVEILEAAGEPLHITKIVKAMRKYGIFTNKSRMIGIIGGDRRGRFIRTDTSTFGLNPNPKPFAMSPALARKRKDHPFPSDFSLIESIQKLIPELTGEFSQQTVFDILVERNPDAAPYLDRASISKTLNRLKDRGLIEMTYKGYGIEPRRYKKAEVFVVFEK